MTGILADRLSAEQVFDEVLKQLATYDAQGPATDVSDVGPETSLVSDLGFDSISLVGFAAAVEDALNIDALPLMEWSDREADRDGTRFSVGSFVDLCLKSTLRPQGGRPVPKTLETRPKSS